MNGLKKKRLFHTKKTNYTADWHILRQHFTYPKYQQKNQENMRNYFKIDHKDTEAKALASFWCLYVNFEKISFLI